MSRILILSLLMLVLCTPATKAQSWQWGKAISYDSVGGRYWPNWDRNYAVLEGGPIDMTTDEAGNVYALILVNSSNLKVAGLSKSGHGGYDILLTSFSCDGQYRWSKLIGSSSDSDAAVSVRASAETGVFVAGSMTMALPGGAHFGNDTVVAGLNKTMFIAKWDTAGNFQWLRLPQPDTMSHLSAVSQPADMDLGSDGTVYLLAGLTPGAYAGGRYVVNTLGAHVLRYSSSGQFLGGVALNILPDPLWPQVFLSTICLYGMRYDGANQRLILPGSKAVWNHTTIGGMQLTGDVSFVASFDAATGAMSWLKTSSPMRQQGAVFKSSVIFRDRPQVDAQGNVYLAGWSSDSGVFNGVLFHNPVQEDMPVDFVTKLDAATGNALWTTIGRGSSRENGVQLSGLTLIGNKLAITGYYNDSLIYPGGLLTNNPLVDSGDAYIVQMDASTGAVQKMASLTGLSYTWGNRITADRRGNFYITGSYAQAAQTIGSDVLTLNNYSNYFIAKWGWANCTCTPAKAALVKSASVGLSQAFTYTGSGTNLDSLVWDFGDGTKQKITSGFSNAVLHNYAATGHYTVCVTAYDESCGGSSTACLPLALVVGNMAALKGVQVYPNPATDAITVEGAAGARLELLNALGQREMNLQVLQPRQTFSLRSLPAGIYLLRITDASGNSGVVRISRR